MVKGRFTVLYEEEGDFILDSLKNEWLDMEEVCRRLNDYYYDMKRLLEFYRDVVERLEEEE